MVRVALTPEETSYLRLFDAEKSSERPHYIHKRNKEADWFTAYKIIKGNKIHPGFSNGLFQQAFYDEKQKLGKGFRKKTTYFMLDIDSPKLGDSGKYHPSIDQEAFNKIIDVLRVQLGIKGVVPMRSSGSKGVHLYVPLGAAYNSWNIGTLVHDVLTSNEFVIKNGWLEIFPNKKSSNKVLYKSHKLLLQPGTNSYLLNPDDITQPIKTDLFTSWSLLEQFWKEAAENNGAFDTHYREHFNNHSSEYVKGENKFSADEMLRFLSEMTQQEQYQPCNDYGSSNAKDFYKGVMWESSGQTYDNLQQLSSHGCYKYRITDVDELTNWMVYECRKAPGFYEFSHHVEEIEELCKSWAETTITKFKANDQNYYGKIRHTKTKQLKRGRRVQQLNNKAKKLSVKRRIENAVKLLVSQGEKITISRVAREAGVSRPTISKPEYKALLP